MLTEPPFQISLEAKDRLASAAIVPNVEPGILRGFRFEVRSKEGEITDSFEEEHYSICYNTAVAWTSDHSAIPIAVDNRTFWLPPDTLENLKGKTLTRIRRYEGAKQLGKIQNVLVAVQPDA